MHSRRPRLVEKLRPAAGIRHLDVAGGTGDVAFRVLRAIRAAEATRGPSAATRPGSVVIADINAAMLLEGRKRAASQGIGEGRGEYGGGGGGVGWGGVMWTCGEHQLLNNKKN